MSIVRGPWRTPAGAAPELALEPLDGVEQLQRLERGADAQAGVQEARLVEHLADGVGVVGRGAGQHLHAGAGQRVDGGLQMRAAIADVGAEPEQPDASLALALTPSAHASAGASGARRLQARRDGLLAHRLRRTASGRRAGGA